MNIAQNLSNVNSLPATGSWYVRPGWVTSPGADDGGWGYYAACDVATGRTIAENDDISALVQHMTLWHPHLALVENMATAAWRSCLRTVPPEERL